MTTLQKAQELLARLPEKDLQKIITFMTDLLDHKEPKAHSKLPDVDPQELHREFEAILAEFARNPIVDIDAARESAMVEKYGKCI